MLYPHCTYTGDQVIGSGSVYQVLGVDYVGSDANMYSLDPSNTGSLSEMKGFLDLNLSGYGEWTMEVGELPSVNFSPNQILIMTMEEDGNPVVNNFTQSACVELPLSGSEVLADDFITQENLHDMNLVDIWLTMVIAIFVVIRLIIFKGVLGRNF